LHTGHGGELVRDALDADAGDRGAAERGEQDAAKAVAEGVTEALVERLDRERAATVVDLLGGDAGDLEISGHEFLAYACSEISGIRTTWSTARRSAAPVPAPRSRSARGSAGSWR